MLFDAIVLAGGRSSRLGGVPKSELIVGGRTLLLSTLETVTDARRTAVVGPRPRHPLAAHVVVVREDPPFAGPAAAIAAGLAALREAEPTDSPSPYDSGARGRGRGRAHSPSRGPSHFTLVLACDMPRVSLALPSLLSAVRRNPHSQGAIAVDSGRAQPLAAIYATDPLTDAARRHAAEGTLEGLGAFRLVAGLRLDEVTVPAGSTDDVDTWTDADRLGLRRAEERPDEPAKGRRSDTEVASREGARP